MASKKSKTSSATTANTTSSDAFSGTSTSTPNTPSWVTDIAGQLSGQIPGVKTQVAGLSGLQQDAVSGLSNQNFGGLFGDAASALRSGMGQPITSTDVQPGTGNTSALGGVESWLNPFLGGVVDATANDLNATDARTRAQQELNIARSGAFGGSGAALTRSSTEGELERARASALGGLRMGAYDAAAGNSQLDANRNLQAELARSGISVGNADRNLQAQTAGRTLNNQAATSLAGIGQTGLGLQTDLGNTVRGIDQAGLNVPITDLITKLGLFGDMSPYAQLLTGQTTANNGTKSGASNATGTGTGKASETGVDWGKLLFGTSFA